MIPYIPIYIQYLGLSASQNGLIFGGLPFVAMLSKPITGGLADRGTFRPATLSRIFVAIQIVFMFSIYFVPRLEAEKELPIINQHFLSNHASANRRPSAGLRESSCGQFQL